MDRKKKILDALDSMQNYLQQAKRNRKLIRNYFQIELEPLYKEIVKLFILSFENFTDLDEAEDFTPDFRDKMLVVLAQVAENFQKVLYRDTHFLKFLKSLEKTLFKNFSKSPLKLEIERSKEAIMEKAGFTDEDKFFNEIFLSTTEKDLCENLFSNLSETHEFTEEEKVWAKKGMRYKERSSLLSFFMDCALISMLLSLKRDVNDLFFTGFPEQVMTHEEIEEYQEKINTYFQKYNFLDLFFAYLDMLKLIAGKVYLEVEDAMEFLEDSVGESEKYMLYTAFYPIPKIREDTIPYQVLHESIVKTALKEKKKELEETLEMARRTVEISENRELLQDTVLDVFDTVYNDIFGDQKSFFTGCSDDFKFGYN